MWKNHPTWVEDSIVESAKIVAQPLTVVCLSNVPWVSINKTATSSPLRSLSKNGFDHIVMPVVSRWLPEKNSKQLKIQNITAILSSVQKIRKKDTSSPTKSRKRVWSSDPITILVLLRLGIQVTQAEIKQKAFTLTEGTSYTNYRNLNIWLWM